MNAQHDTGNPPRGGWLVFRNDALLGAGDSEPAARDDADRRCRAAVAGGLLDITVRPCTLAELDNAVAVLTSGPGVGRLARHVFEIDGERFFQIGRRSTPAETTCDVIPAIGVTWNPKGEAGRGTHGEPRYPRCPDCSATAMSEMVTGTKLKILECAGCGSLFRAHGLLPAQTAATKPAPESAAILRHEAADACIIAARLLREQTDDQQAQILIHDAELAVKKMRAALAPPTGE